MTKSIQKHHDDSSSGKKRALDVMRNIVEYVVELKYHSKNEGIL